MFDNFHEERNAHNSLKLKVSNHSEPAPTSAPSTGCHAVVDEPQLSQYLISPQ